MGRLLTVDEAAARLGLSTKTLYWWASLDPPRIPHIRLGSRLRFDPEALDAWVAENSTAAGAPAR